MRIAIAQVWQETNTFSVVPSELKDFAAYRLYVGEEVIPNCRGK